MTSHDDLAELGRYFENASGVGVLATADADGVIDLALFARPHHLEEGELGFIMPERRTYTNLSKNPHAAYLFIEDEEDGAERRFQGTRLYLKKIAEEQDTERVQSLRRRTYDDDRDGRFLVRFELESVRPLVGG